MAEKRFYLALRGQDKDAGVEDALWQLADVLTGEGRIYVEDMRDLEPFVAENRFWEISGRIEKIREERATQLPHVPIERQPDYVSRDEEKELEERFRKEYGALPVYEFTIRKIGFVDDVEEVKFHRIEEDTEK